MRAQISENYRAAIPISANKSIFRQSVELGQMHRSLLVALEVDDFLVVDLSPVELQLSIFMYFLLVDSMVCRSSVLEVVYRELQNKELEVHHCEQGFFVEINKPLDGLALSSNDGVERTTIFRFFLSTYALASLHKLYQISGEGSDTLQCRENLELIDLLNTLTEGLGRITFSSLNHFCAVSAEFSMRNIYPNMPLFLAEFARGKTPSHAMPLQNLHLFYQRKTYPELVIKPLPRMSAKLMHHSNFDLIAVKREPEPSKGYIRLIETITTLLTIDRDYKQKKELADLIGRIKKALDDKEAPFSARILLEWMLFNLEHNKWRHPETPKKYLRKVGEDWLRYTVGEDLHNVDGAEMDCLCQQITQHDNAKGEKRWRLRSLIIFGIEYFELTAPDDPFYSLADDAKYVRSLVVPPHIINQVSHDLRQLYADKDDYSKRVVKTLYIVISRLFLRPTEVVRLLIEDVELSTEGCLFIRPNKGSRLKTINSKRTVPYGLLLPSDERVVFETFVKLRLQHCAGDKKAYLFSKSELSNTSFSTSELEDIFSPLISKFFGYAVPIYQFRHTGITSLAATVFGSEKFIKHFSVFSIEQSNRIKKELVGNRNRDKLWAIAMVAGHQTPQTTLFSYIHICELLLADIIRRSEKRHSTKFWLNISALPARQLKLLGQAEQSKTNTVAGDIMISSERISPNLVKKMEKFATRDSVIDRRTFENKPAPDERVRPNVHQCYDVLRKVDLGCELTNILLESPVDEDIVKAWIESANSVAVQYKSRNGRPRLFSQEGKICPFYQKLDDGDFGNVLQSFRNEYKKNQEELRWCIDYTLNHVSNIKSYIRFDDVNNYLRFMKAVTKLTSCDRWHLKLELGSEKPASAQKWQLISGVKLTRKEARTNNTEIGTLFFSKPIVDGKNRFNKRSSRAIRFLFHMAKIMLVAEQSLSSRRSVISKGA